MVALRLKHIYLILLLSLLFQSVGGWLNELAVSANKGTMPVWVFSEKMGEALMAEALSGDQTHSILTANSRYKILTDIFPVVSLTSDGIDITAMASLGDLGIFVGQSGCFLTVFLFLIFPFVGIYKKFLRSKYEDRPSGD